MTGLIAQQQCVGPFHTPLADVAVIALSPFDLAGGATSVGEQPIKMMFDVKRGARLSVVEALTNLVFAKISSLKVVLRTEKVLCNSALRKITRMYSGLMEDV